MYLSIPCFCCSFVLSAVWFASEVTCCNIGLTYVAAAYQSYKKTQRRKQRSADAVCPCFSLVSSLFALVFCRFVYCLQPCLKYFAIFAFVFSGSRCQGRVIISMVRASLMYHNAISCNSIDFRCLFLCSCFDAESGSEPMTSFVIAYCRQNVRSDVTCPLSVLACQ